MLRYVSRQRTSLQTKKTLNFYRPNLRQLSKRASIKRPLYVQRSHGAKETWLKGQFAPWTSQQSDFFSVWIPLSTVGSHARYFLSRDHWLRRIYNIHSVLLTLSSHTGNVRILEVNPDGNYVRIFNTSGFKVSSFLTFKVHTLIALQKVVKTESQFLPMNCASYRVLLISELAFLLTFSSIILTVMCYSQP